MAMLINGERIPDELVEAEFVRMRASHCAANGSAPVSEDHLRLMAACAVVDRILIRQHADRDPRPIDPEIIDAEMRRESPPRNCRTGINEPGLRLVPEQGLRSKRAMEK